MIKHLVIVPRTLSNQKEQVMNLDNELVNQKNHLLELVADEKFEEAITILEFVAE